MKKGKEMVERTITLNDILKVMRESAKISVYDENDDFIVSVECEKAKKYLSRIILRREVEKIEGEDRYIIAIKLKEKGQPQPEKQETGEEND